MKQVDNIPVKEPHAKMHVDAGQWFRKNNLHRAGLQGTISHSIALCANKLIANNFMMDTRPHRNNLLCSVSALQTQASGSSRGSAHQMSGIDLGVECSNAVWRNR